MGYFSYDYIKYSEPVLRNDLKDEDEFKDVDLMLFDKVRRVGGYGIFLIIIRGNLCG